MSASPQENALALFRRSVLKQRKLAEIVSMLGSTNDLRCLDLGSDNGVVSLLLRARGGQWSSADLTDEAVAAIGELVGTETFKVDGRTLPFGDAELDRVVVVDMLEHVADDGVFVAELARITRPGGILIVNTPHLKDTWLRKVRHAIGLTDEKHGHLRPGYDPAVLARLFGDRFRLEEHRTYSRFFSEAIDTAINFAVERLGKKSSSKGMVVTGADLKKHERLFRAYSLVYPIVWTVAKLDLLIPWSSGYMLIARAVREGAPLAREAGEG
jgi:SAM-dependent methyltransferase